MTTATADGVRRALTRVLDPEIRVPITDLDMVDAVSIDGGVAIVDLSLTIVGCPASDRIERDTKAAAMTVPGVLEARVRLGVMSPERRAALTKRLKGDRQMPFTPDSLTRVIAVTSGKGGVGKSTVTANLAVALAARGLSVGIVDADVHGYSIPGLLGLPPDLQPTRIDRLMLPPIAHGVKAISIGMFLSAEQRGAAIAWRGPMLHRTVQQFLTDVHFGDLDVLVLDTPPGTGDVAISLGQLLPHAEVLVVTTPQRAATEVAVRSGQVARQLGQRVIGVVETMSPARAADGTVLDLFGSGGGETVAAALSTAGETVPLLANVPLSGALRRSGDDGVPVVLSTPSDAAAEALRGLAAAVVALRPALRGRPLPFSV
jgi:ATP-binding protein involved in chromosome partitioning